MKNKISNYIKLFMLMFFMTMGFFLVYGCIWDAFEFPIEDWAVVTWVILAILSEFTYIWWLRRD